MQHPHGIVHQSPPQAGRRDGTVRLPDGRTLGFAQYGDPAAPPVLYFHGFPSSRLEAGLIPIPGVRLISPDRPGYGLSDPKPGRSLLDWAMDVEALLDALHLDRVALIGMSGGAPYAAACAHSIPHRLTATALVSGMAPPGFGWEAGSPAGFLMGMGRRPMALRPMALRLTAHTVRGFIRGGDPLALAGLLRRRAGLPPSDRVLLNADAGEKVVTGWREAVRGGVEGPVSDALVYARHWGFPLEGIRGRVSVWHGTADTTVPVAAGRLYAARIPGARAHILEGEGHFSLIFKHHPAILRELLEGPADAVRAA